MKNALIKIYKELFDEDYIEKEQDRCQKSKCLWLVTNVPLVSEKLSVDLGTKRHREKRPMITIRKVKKNYLCRFLTSKSNHCGHNLKPVEVEIQKCNKLCDDFHFIKQSYIFIYVDFKKNTYRENFKISEWLIKDTNLFQFCGVCSE